MHDVEIMTVVECVEDGSYYITGFEFTKLFLFQDLVKEFATLQEFHHDVNVLVIFINVVTFHNIWVVNLLQDFNFIAQSSAIVFGEFTPKVLKISFSMFISFCF